MPQAYRADLERIVGYEEQRFVERRNLDNYSKRKQEEEADRTAAGIISNTEHKTNTGLATLQSLENKEKAVEADVDMVSKAAYQENWTRAYKTAYEKGIRAWNEAEKRAINIWTTWQRTRTTTVQKGQAEWNAGFEALQAKRQAWVQRFGDI